MKYKAVAFDVDGTISSHISSWQLIHESLGIWSGNAEAYQEKFLAGEISYREFCELDAARWKGIKEEKVRKLFLEASYTPNSRECLRELKRLGFKIAAVSTGLQYIPEIIAEEFSFDAVACNRLLAENGRLTGEVRIDVSHAGKGDALRKILAESDLKAEETIGVGDSEGDIRLAEECGYFIAFNSSSKLLDDAADYKCLSGDFREVMDAILDASGITGSPPDAPDADRL